MHACVGCVCPTDSQRKKETLLLVYMCVLRIMLSSLVLWYAIESQISMLFIDNKDSVSISIYVKKKAE